MQNAKDLIGMLPDYNDLLKLAEEISCFQYEKSKLELELKEAEALIFRTALSDEKFFVGGKPPSIASIEANYKITGFNGELIPIRKRLLEATLDFDNAKQKFDVYKLLFEVWRTLSSNERQNQF